MGATPALPINRLMCLRGARPYCPWLSEPDDDGELGEGQRRCGWRWTLEMLIPTGGPDEAGDAQAPPADFNPQARLRSILNNIWK